MVTLESLPADADTEGVASALARDGGVIITGIADAALVDQVASELAPHYVAEGDKYHNDFNGYRTRRPGGVYSGHPQYLLLDGHPDSDVAGG